MTDPARVPQNLYAVTLGCRDASGQRSFYEAWGWTIAPFSTDEYVAFDLGGAMVSFYDTGKLAEEAAPGARLPDGNGWNGLTLAVNVGSRESVDSTWRAAVHAGAESIGEPVDRPWGGRSGYVADPEGNRWEIAWVPPTPGATSPA
jgi:uncharacterized glyoxalase superfamily protein PhnB